MAGAGLGTVKVSAAKDVDFQQEIQPLLKTHCVKCHGSEKQKGGLRLDRKSAALKGGESGEPGVVPGKASESRLLHLIKSRDNAERMPPEGDPLSDSEIDLFRRWIDEGAQWPDADSADAASGRSQMIVTDDDRQHWSFRPLELVTPPVVKDQEWVRTPIDQFIRHAQEAQGLTPTARADASTLVRRIYYDLIGLPPEVTSKDLSTDDLVDSLLASPHYGERWARHWLDVARYADSDGQESDTDRPNAYHYRDFVIHSLNEDRPYNTFVQWQLAGDEIAPDNPEAVSATGFIVAGTSTDLNVPMEEEKLRNRANELDDMVSTTAQAFLGLTLACARCHDHKYDPLPTRDYYRMMCAFNGGDRCEVPLADSETVRINRAAHDAWQKELTAAESKRSEWLKSARQPIARQVLSEKVAKLSISDDEKTLLLDQPDDSEAKKLLNKFKKELKIEDAEYAAALPPADQAQWKELDAAVKAVNGRKPATLPTTFAFADFAAEPRETWFFERGDFMARNERMSLGFLTVMTRGTTPENYWTAARGTQLRDDSTQQRRAMADWMVDTEHGAGVLLARVMVNRVWQHHFGEGLVRTVSDFGTRGELPSHPELLEWLTAEFIRSNWSIKHLHRLIVNSATWQQGTAIDAAKNKIDPENRLLWRRRPQRLESEIMRDAMLSVAGTLNTEMFGPSFKPPIPNEAMQARNVKNPYPRDVQDTPAVRRRSIYMFHKRVVQYPLMLAFDAPDAQVSCGRRINTTVAPQALALLNDPFVRLRASELAERLITEAGPGVDDQLRHAFRLGLNRFPNADELSDAHSFVVDQAAVRQQRDKETNPVAAQRLAMTDFCQMLFSLNEFVYVD